MSEELQGLLERIHEKGIKEAEAEKAKIIASAQEEADRIVKVAKEKADKIIKDAKEEAEVSQKKAKAAIQQAGRDIILSLKQEIENRLRRVILDSVGESMTCELMQQIIIKMVEEYSKRTSQDAPDIELLVSKKDLEEVEKRFKAGLIENLKKNPDISLAHDFSAGIKIGFKDENVFFDFSDEAITDIISQYIGEKLAELFKSDSKDTTDS